MSDQEVPAWEACKENVLPIKRGRSAKGLNDALSATSSSSLAVQEKSFELACEAAEKSGSCSDILEKYCQYIKWVRDAFPTQQDKTLKLLGGSYHILPGCAYHIYNFISSFIMSYFY